MEDTEKRDVRPYRGRLAPTPTGYMHFGHARTFWEAQRRSQEKLGTLIMRVEDLDMVRCKNEFVSALFDDLRWAGLDWQEGPEEGGDYGPYRQSQRQAIYVSYWRILRDAGKIYPCLCSRKDVQNAIGAPRDTSGEFLYPGTCRGRSTEFESEEDALRVNWRFRVPDGDVYAFDDGRLGPRSLAAGRDFGDFLVWRKDGFPSYELAVVVDDIAMKITEVVRGEDLLVSTARQGLLYAALMARAPEFYHCPLVTDATGRRLAKRDGDFGLRELRARGVEPGELLLMDYDEIVSKYRI